MRKYTDEEKKRYWRARCEKCGWHGLTCDCGGGWSMADTGDYDDCHCPKCGAIVDGNDESYDICIRVLWLWRAITFWVWLKRRSERLAEEAFVERCRKEWGE